MNVFYNAFKIGGCVMILRDRDYSQILYEKFVLPLFNKYKMTVDESLVFLGSQIKEFKNNPLNANIDYNLYNYLEPHIRKLFSQTRNLKIVKKFD
jgi:hypothetical protein